jgi:hypothetical protein
MLRESIWRDMRRSPRRVVDPAGPTLNIAPDGARFLLGDDMVANVEETKRFSPSDAAALVPFEEDLARLVRGVVPAFDWIAPDPAMSTGRDLREAARWEGWRSASAGCSPTSPSCSRRRPPSTCRSISRRYARGARAARSTIRGRPVDAGDRVRAVARPRERAADGGVRQWGFVRGGMGRVTELMAEAAREAGCEIRTNAEVERIVTRGGAATGVRLSTGEEIAARRVVSNADPKRTFLGLADPADLPEEFLARIEAYRCMGTSMKINLAIGGLPGATGDPDGAVQPYHRGIMELNPFVPDMDASSRRRRPRGSPPTVAHRAVLPDGARPSSHPRASTSSRRELAALHAPRPGLGHDQRRSRRPGRRRDRASTSRRCRR